MTNSNWVEITKSQHSWELEALEFVRSHFPAHEPYRAWSNFEFIALDGSINEVDLLVFTSVGFFLIEIKSRPGFLSGDAGTWTWKTDGKFVTMDNPIFAADLKAKKLKSLLQQQKIAKRNVAVPFMDALIFCSDPNLQCTLSGTAASHICLRDRKPSPNGEGGRRGIIAAIKNRECEGLKSRVFGDFNTPTSKMISQALKLAGIRQSQRHRKVGDYQLESLIGEGRGYQDWSASHVLLQNSKRRIRIYNIRTSASPEEQQTLERAARREAELLEGLQHPGVLKREGYTPHELGPALVFEYDPQAVRLDHYVSQHADSLSASDRCRLLREIAEVMRYAHERQTYHRGLAPQSILVNPTSSLSQVKLFNWQSGYRGQQDDVSVSRLVSATSHLDRLVDDAVSAYIAPEALRNEESQGEKQDLFSLGAIAYYLFSGQAPAANGIELSEKLRDTDGLQISAVMSGASENLNTLIQWTTSPIVGERIDSANEFLELLSHVESDLKISENNYVEDPNVAVPGDTFPGDHVILQRIGSGASSIAFLVESDELLILKVARDPEFNDRLQDEGEILGKFRHSRIAECVGSLEVGRYRGLLIRPAMSDRKKQKIETLRHRLKEDGALHLDMLQRFGDDLLSAVAELEENGVTHRDIKPDNIAIGSVRSGDQLHAMLFDFSLAKMSPENINAGTSGYLDPMLPLRKSRRFDSYAERYAASVTLYQMATGHKNFPVWSPDGSDPTHLDNDGQIDAELFDVNVRDSLTQFFERAFRRDLKLRHDNAEQMKHEWNVCFANLEDAGSHSDHLDEEAFQRCLESATLDTLVTELGLGARAVSAMDRKQISDVRQLLGTNIALIHRWIGIGKSTVSLIKRAIRTLSKRLLPAAEVKSDPQILDDSSGAAVDIIQPERLSIAQLVHRIQRVSATQPSDAQTALQKLLTIDASIADTIPVGMWPSLQQLSELTGANHVQLRKWIDAFRTRWDKDAAITQVRSDLSDLIASLGGIASVDELASALLAARGSHLNEPMRTRYAVAVVCASIEVETYKAAPRYALRRGDYRLLISSDPKLSQLALELGQLADSLALEDPLVSPVRALEQLRLIANQYEESMSDARLIRLAASSSKNAAVSSRNEFYPKGMEPGRAIKLSQSALYGTSSLSAHQIRGRVMSRYPLCAPIPDQPDLERLLKEAGFDYRWDERLATFISTIQDSIVISSGSDSFSRFTTTHHAKPVGNISEEVAAARQFEDKIQRARKEGAFLAIVAEPKLYQQAIIELSSPRIGAIVVDAEGLFLDLMRDVSNKANIDWGLVLDTDREPGLGDWANLLLLAKRVMPQFVQAVLSHSGKTVLLTYPSLLARYDQISVLNELQNEIGKTMKGLWLLLPGNGPAMIGREAVSLVTPNQCTSVPKSWLENQHRGLGVVSGQ